MIILIRHSRAGGICPCLMGRMYNGNDPGYMVYFLHEWKISLSESYVYWYSSIQVLDHEQFDLCSRVDVVYLDT